MSLIGRLRELPPHRRKRVALYLAGGLTFFIIIGWAIVPRKSATRTPEKIDSEFSQWGESINEQVRRLKSGWIEAIEGFKALSATSTTEDASSTPIETSTSTPPAPEGAGGEGN